MPELLFIGLIAGVAFLYATVGHGGASGYLALMALAGIPALVMKPSALVLNVCVSCIAFVQFHRAGHFQWRLLWPFALASVPMSWLGAQVEVDPLLYERVLAVCLLLAVARMLVPLSPDSPRERPLRVGVALVIGAVLGFLSGMIGIGGGILLSPILLLAGWADAKTTAAVSAPFILVNSIAALVGLHMSNGISQGVAWSWVGAAAVGGLLGGWIGAERLPVMRLRQVLGAVLLFASIKLLLP